MATEIGQLTLKVDTGDVAKATDQVEKLGDKAQSTTKKTENLTKQSAKSNVVMGQFGRKAGMAGIQFEQLAGQIAAGQNPMRAIGVQAADLGFVLGTPLLGAVVGIGAALASVMLPGLLNNKDAAKTLSEAMDRLSLVVKRTETGSFKLTERFVQLAQKSRELAAIDIAIGIAQATIAFETASKQIKKELENIVGKIGPTTAAFEEIRAAIEKTGEVPDNLRGYANWADVTGEKFGITRNQALDLILAFKGFQDGVVPLADLRSEVLLLAENGDMTKKSTRDLVSAFLDNVVAASNAEEALKALKDVVGDTGSALSDATREADGFAATVGGMISVLERRDEVLRNSEEDLAVQAATLRGATDAEILQIRALYEAIAAEKARQEAVKQAAREKEQATRDAERRAEREAAAAERQAEREAEAAKRAADAKVEAEKRAAEAAAEQRERAAISAMESLATEEEAILLSYQRRHDAIMASTQMTEEMKRDLITRLDAETNQKLLESNQSYWQQWLTQQNEAMITFDEVAAGALNTFKTAAGSAFESIIFDSESASDAVRNFAETMGRSVINALGQMAAEWAAYYIVQSLFGKTAQAGAATAMTANAAATSAQAGLAAFASTAAIPIVGPALAPGAAAAAIAATAPFVTAISALSTAAIAGRALGGQVRGGESYVVGERGPELLTMGSGGRITPNEMLRGNSRNASQSQQPKTELKVQVQNYGSSEISVERISATDVRIIAREVAAQTVRDQAPGVVASDISNPNGRVSKSLSNNVIAQRRR